VAAESEKVANPLRRVGAVIRPGVYSLEAVWRASKILAASLHSASVSAPRASRESCFCMGLLLGCIAVAFMSSGSSLRPTRECPGQA
jgi:hypothetical protein